VTAVSKFSPGREWGFLAAGVAALGAVTLIYADWLRIENATVVGLTYLLVILLVAAAATLRVAVTTSLLALLAFNYFFFDPVRTFTIADPLNWFALFAFLVVSVVASRLSLVARQRAEEATTRRDEMGRLFDLSRDILLATDARDAVDVLVRYVSRRFNLDHVTICLPTPDGWKLHESGDGLTLDRSDLDVAMASARGTLQFDAQTRTYGGHRLVRSAEGLKVWLVPLRLGMRAVGLLAASGREMEPGSLDALAGLAAIAIERAKLLEERQDSERIRQSAELKSALLSSLGHDLKTPLTAITAAAGNLRGKWGDEPQRREQLDIITGEISRLNRLFQNIVEMARIETGAVDAEHEWVVPQDIIEAAIQHVQQSLAGHELDVVCGGDVAVLLDPRLTSAALAHMLENAGQYSPAGSTITVTATVDADTLTVAVRDRGRGVDSEDLQFLFERFYRGADARRRAFGTGMGLAITRGLLAAQGGHVWAENHADGGAVFTLRIPAPSRVATVPAGEPL